MDREGGVGLEKFYDLCNVLAQTPELSISFSKGVHFFLSELTAY